MQHKKNKKYCVYCGVRLSKPEKTRDHVPPKSFFTESDRNHFQAITVPSCSVCNNDYKVQDEHAKYVMQLATTQMRQETLEMTQLLSRTLRANNRLGRTIRAATPSWVQDSQTGIYTPEVEVAIDKQYLMDTQQVFQRIARGLYWHHYRKRLSVEDYRYQVVFPAGLDLVRSGQKSQLRHHKELELLLELTHSSQPFDLLPGVFNYWIGTANDNENYSVISMILDSAVKT